MRIKSFRHAASVWAVLATLATVGAAHAETSVTFASLDTTPGTNLAGRLYPAPGNGRHPAAIFLHGCGGLFDGQGRVYARERDWAGRLNAAGVSVLMVDSFGPRHHGEMCAPDHFDRAIYRARPADAYGALRYLQQQSFVAPDRIALVGWSQGGGAVLYTIRSDSTGRPATLPDGDFRAAVAFYPASCNLRRQGEHWASQIPLLVLVGDADVWTPAAPCQALMDAALAGSRVQLRRYPGAYHDFDWPGMPVHELPKDRTRDGIVPILGTDPAARADAQERVVRFLEQALDAGNTVPVRPDSRIVRPAISDVDHARPIP
jgi:dienelactone hydrolase